MSGLMSIGLRAMFASTAQLQTTGHNISNANVVGYSRQEVELATSKGQYTGAGFFGKGVDVVNVRRAHDDFLTMQAAVARSLSAMDQTRYAQLSQLEEVFPPGENGLGYSMGEFFGAAADLANNPSDSSARQVMLARAADVADRYAYAGQQLDMMQTGVSDDLRNSVAIVNTLTTQIAQLNQAISSMRGTGAEPNDLLDQRAQAIDQLSGYLQVSTIEADDGSLGVFVAGGQMLVLGSDAHALKVVPDLADASRSSVAMAEDQGAILEPDRLAGGSIAALLQFQNGELVDARNQLGQMAAAFAGRVNEIQALGVDLSATPGAGGPIFAIGEPRVLPNFRNERDLSGDFLSSVDIAITDADLLQASDYELSVDPSTPGQYILVRLSDGVSRTVVDGDEVDGFQITIGTPAPTGEDKFLLQPVGRAGHGMERVMDDPNGIAAASPVTATTSPANTGTATVAALRVVDPAIDPTLTASFTFGALNADGGRDYTWELRDSTNTVVSTGTDTWHAGEAMELNGFELSLNGVPESGDVVTVAQTAYTSTNNGNALAMVALRDETFVGRRLDGSGNHVGGNTVTDAYAAAMANVGVQVQSAHMAADMSEASRARAEAEVASKTGVNLDEEAARMIQYQQSYQAAAKVIQVAQSVFDTLLEVAGR